MALLGILMLIVGALMLRLRDADHVPVYEGRSDGLAAGLVLPTGMASGFFGIGGGFLIVPCLLYATRMPMIDAVGSSLLAVASFPWRRRRTTRSPVSSRGPSRSGSSSADLSAVFAGISCAGRVCRQKDRLRQAFSAVIFMVAAYILYRSLGGVQAT